MNFLLALLALAGVVGFFAGLVLAYAILVALRHLLVYVGALALVVGFVGAYMESAKNHSSDNFIMVGAIGAITVWAACKAIVEHG